MSSLEHRTDVQTLYVAIEPGHTVQIRHPQHGQQLPLTDDRIKEKLKKTRTVCWIERIRGNEWAIFPEFSGYGMLLEQLHRFEDDLRLTTYDAPE